VTTSTSRGSTETAQRDEGNTEEAESHVRLAADAGITFFDTADMYSDGVSEEVTGAALPAVFGRRDAYLATKVFMPTGPGLRIGSMCAWQFSKAQRTAALHGWTEFVSMQSDYNLLYREESARWFRCAWIAASGPSPGAPGTWAPRSAGGRGAGDRAGRTDPRQSLYGEAETAVLNAVAGLPRPVV
jgi:aryl-alcohol dehydrogenase-like predicted oxidoreductase